jgi:uncharacterized membrane protein
MTKKAETAKTKDTKIRRNYQFVQFLMDLLGLFVLYILITAIIDDIAKIHAVINSYIRAEGAEELIANPYPLIVWGVIGTLIYAAGIVMPLVFKRKTRLNQKQYDMWVYSVLCLRILALILVFNFMGIHFSVIMKSPNFFEPAILMTAILFAIIVRFTQIRIRAAEPKKEGKIRIITED